MSGYEPYHLLDFEVKGETDLQFCYRSLVKSSYKDGIKTGLGRCSACNAVLPTLNCPRLKPLRRMTKAIQKLIAKTSNKIPLSRMENFKLKKFMQSSQQMVVRCTECGFVDKKPTISRQELIKLKDERLLSVKEEEKDPKEKEDEEASDQVKTKRKRKKKKKKQKTPVRKNLNSLLLDDEDEKQDVSVTPSTAPTNLMDLSQSATNSKKKEIMSLSKFVKSEIKDTSSTSLFEQAVHNKALLQHTPLRPPKQKADTLSKSMSLSKKKSTLLHKQLKSYLIDQTKEEEKSPSLMDFLTSL